MVYYALLGSTDKPLPLPKGEVARISGPERALSVTFGDSSPRGRAKFPNPHIPIY